MRAQIIRIGNSRGIRVPRALLEQCHLDGPVNLEVHEGRLVIGPLPGVRTGWDEAFARMAARKDDALLDGDRCSATAWESAQWEW